MFYPGVKRKGSVPILTWPKATVFSAEKSGPEVIKELKDLYHGSRQSKTQIPLIVLIVDSEDYYEMLTKYAEQGFDYLLIKPLNAKLMRRLSALMNLGRHTRTAAH